MSIKLPELFTRKLEGHPKEMGAVHASIAVFEQWFATSGTPFFRDYTDHGPKHIESVLSTAAAMIPATAHPTFSAADVTIFVLATLLHDSALHLAEPGFHHLIVGDARNRCLQEFDSTSWPALWDDFLFAAKRWDDRKLRAVFGDDFVERSHSVSNPLDRWGNCTSADYKLIGEFIRLHHPRLAHEFAVFGVPGTTSSAINLPDIVPEKWREISGIVARSHGVALRPCVDHLERCGIHRRDFQGIHALYLMALLRLSDYLQIDAGRAPEVVFRFRVLPSRVSALEWRAHNAVKNITPEHEDPESVEIQAEPTDVETYLRLRDWLDGIQSELDTSWAVLGEVYGRFDSLRPLGLLWRRVRSNLDDKPAYARSVPYLPRRIRLEVARSELLSLLISPLYGDDPSFGVRELMQNAVDAVREREFFLSKHPERSTQDFRIQDADVEVWLSDFDDSTGCAWLEVIDSGIGMTDKVITDYFLTAGASYRNSEQWQKTFERTEVNDGTNKPRSQVVRTGRFGVGALAAFLLGQRIEVETRHITSDEGFKFEITLSQEAVQVERCTDMPIGTLIRCEVTREAFHELQRHQDKVSRPGLWDWFVLDKPRVKRFMGNDRSELSQSPGLNLADWRVAETDKPVEVRWTWGTPWPARQPPALSCNGIFVSNSAKLPGLPIEHSRASEFGIQTPFLHITDPDGYVPLSLTRKEVVGDCYGFEDDLYQSVMKDYIARLLVTFPEELNATMINEFRGQTPFRSERYSTQKNSPDILLTADGFCLANSKALLTSKTKFRHLLWTTSVSALSLIADVSNWDCIVFQCDMPLDEIYRNYSGASTSEDVVRYIGKKHQGFDVAYFRSTDEKTLGLKKSDPEDEDDESEEPVGKTITQTESWYEWEVKEGRKGAVQKHRSRWLVESSGMTSSKFPFKALIKNPEDDRFEMPFVAEFFLNEPWAQPIDAGLLDEWWERYFSGEWIPWKIADRKARFPKAFQELAVYIERYERAGTARHVASSIEQPSLPNI